MRERMRDWSFSASADWVVGILLAVATRRGVRLTRTPARARTPAHYFP